ncbi:hypothetical protein [Spiroplasma endosymbiont of Atherix ibis]|uniref:hypothetical protein n=1 Tax=Spiroplasma endosymbiont of Atherix ibis TaxID=3066291 RepID=UPI0030D2B4DD
MIKITPVERNADDNYFEALQVLNLKPSNAGSLMIDSLASERANSFDWKNIETNSHKFNKYIKDKPWFIEDLYDLSKRSLLKERVWFVIIDDYIEPCLINQISVRNRDKKILKAIITVATINFKDCDWLVQYSYDITKDKVEFNLDSLQKNEQKIDDIERIIRDKILENNWNPKQNGIPIVQWNSFPKNTNFYDLAIEKAEKLNIVNDVIVDQILNLMQKQQEFNSDQETGNPDSATNLKDSKNRYMKISNQVSSMTTEEWTKQIALYSPNSLILKEFRDTADWLEEDIKKHGKAIKDDDNDSAQKNNAEILNINRSATDALELNKDQYENNLRILISLFDKTEIENVNVKLPFRTINKTIIDNAEEIMIKSGNSKGGIK